jgi:short-subunit dehydrogenase
MVGRVIDRYRRIDVVINNAGAIQVGPVESMTLDDYRDAMDIHFWAPLHVANAVLPHMRRAGQGRIVNIASIGGKIPVPHLLPYTASKFALVGWSRGLRMELAQHNIVVTTVCPGLMRTGSPRNALFKSRHREEYAWFKLSDSTPLTAMHSRRAARQICEAIARGDAEIVLTTQAKIAAKLDALFPELSTSIAEWANKLLPEYGGIGTQARTGAQSETRASSNVLTAPGDRAARRNNEMS